MRKPHQKTGGALSRRIRFPIDEARLPWLAPLLDACALVDTGVSIAVRNAGKQKKIPACFKGCAVCCSQKDIPVYPHEVVGIYWYVSEKLDHSMRTILRKQLVDHGAGAPCPFLVHNACSIHAMRPAACRWFTVFGTPCAAGEDPYYSRRDDVLVPIEEYTDRAFTAVKAFYTQTNDADSAGTVRLVRSRITNLQTVPWKNLAAIIERTLPPQG